MEKPQVTLYLNYREFLRDFLDYLKKEVPGYAQKQIQLELGVASSGFVPNVLAGRKNLTTAQTLKLCKTLNLDRVESTYFENLVLFTQARTVEEKNELFNRLMTMQSIHLKQIGGNALNLFSHWTLVAIREMLGILEWKGDYAFLASKLKPEIRPAEAKEAVESLEQLGLIQKDAQGIYRPSEAAISTGNEVRSVQLAHFQAQTMDLAKQALASVPALERDISVLTMGLSPDTFRLVKQEMQHFRKRIAKIAMEDCSANRIYQLNFQFFPLSEEVMLEEL